MYVVFFRSPAPGPVGRGEREKMNGWRHRSLNTGFPFVFFFQSHVMSYHKYIPPVFATLTFTLITFLSHLVPGCPIWMCAADLG